jgi:CubicO group peptidase (beta-lactamase class C family)
MPLVPPFRSRPVRRQTFRTAVLCTAAAAVALAGLTACSTAPERPVLHYGTAAEAGLDDTALEEALELYRAAVEEGAPQGVVLLVARHGVVAAHEALGWRDREAGLEMRRDTLFRMASNTKPTVATAVLQLVEQGLVDLHAPAARILPAFEQGESAGITVHQLLTHTSGFRIEPIFLSPLLEASPEHPDAPTLQLEVDRFAAIGPEVEPGTSYEYSNPGYNTLGAIVEVASGLPLADYLRRHIYEPLGMDDSSNHESVADHDRMAKVYRRRGEEWRVSWAPGDVPDYPFVRASGGMISTAWDYALFCQAWLNGGVHDGARILSEETVALATTPHTADVVERDEEDGLQNFYGYGWSVRSDGAFAHTGSDGTGAYLYPEDGLFVLVFTQSPGGVGPRADFVDGVRAAVTGRPQL